MFFVFISQLLEGALTKKPNDRFLKTATVKAPLGLRFSVIIIIIVIIFVITFVYFFVVAYSVIMLLCHCAV